MNPNATRSTCFVCGMALILVASSCFPLQAAENVWSVEVLNSRKGEWEQLLQAPLRVEGRISLNARGQLKLAKCELPFVIGETTGRDAPKRGSVQLSGRLKKDDGKFFFDVEQIESILSDVDQFNARSAKLRNPKAEEWYALGDWAMERSRFYDDAELAKKAIYAYEHGIGAAVKNLAADDSKGRFELAGKITRYKLPDAKRTELMHEGYRIKWASVLKGSPNDRAALKQLADEMTIDLAGCAEAIAAPPENLQTRYDKEPLAVYRDSDEKTRRKLHRLFYVSVVLHSILLDAEQDGRNGDAIAERIEQRIPEAAVEANKYRTMKLNWRFERAAAATRSEIEQLANDLRARGYADTARQAVQVWLHAREPRLKEDGALGLLQLAEDYLSLLGDEAKAVAILIDANRRDPAFKDVPQKLNTLGYTNLGGTWVKGAISQMPMEPIPELDIAIGVINVGMTATQLERAMAGRGSITRVYTKSGVTEFWTYPGNPRLTVRLERSMSDPEAKVVDHRSVK